MNNFKKILALIVCTALLAFGAACGAPQSGGENGGVQEKPQSTGVTELTFEQSERADYINWYGRNEWNSSYKAMVCYNSAAGFEVEFWGTELTMSYISDVNNAGFMEGNGYLCIQVDGSQDFKKGFTELNFSSSKKDFSLVSGLTEGRHTVEVYRATEDFCCTLEVYSVKTDGFFLQPKEKPTRKIEVYGDSISAGRGNMRAIGDKETDHSNQENAMLTYSAFAARELDAQMNVFAISGSCVGNYPCTGIGANIIPKLYTKYSGTANARKKWDFTKYVPDAVIVDLGTNDIIGSEAQSGGFEEFSKLIKEEYIKFVQALKEKYPNAAIVLCSGTFNYSKMDLQKYDAVFAEVAASFEESQKVYHCRFEKSDNAHPTSEENQEYGKILAQKLRTVLGWE